MCETYDDAVTDIVYDKKCERLEKPNCFTAYKQVQSFNYQYLGQTFA